MTMTVDMKEIRDKSITSVIAFYDLNEMDVSELRQKLAKIFLTCDNTVIFEYDDGPVDSACCDVVKEICYSVGIPCFEKDYSLCVVFNYTKLMNLS